MTAYTIICRLAADRVARSIGRELPHLSDGQAQAFADAVIRELRRDGWRIVVPARTGHGDALPSRAEGAIARAVTGTVAACITSQLGAGDEAAQRLASTVVAELGAYGWHITVPCPTGGGER
ncbi:hypothetical protein [Streptomyces sp. WMMC897]|uniref:hypothetical protein n=1 Tax=Streptomyces sp. WMMC897 TaxID=3014782 RepID=UPI0022B75498|nr:hypothetical protein [Streptomyces sp. WMMC897]MCZ7414279.1 hypothetical protein [Streptomyces sp. WMMC897]